MAQLAATTRTRQTKEMEESSYGKIKGDKIDLYHGIVAWVIYGLLGPHPPGLLRHNCYNKVLTRIYRHLRFITFVR